MPPQWRCSPHQSAKVSSLCLRAKDHLEGTKVAVFPRYCAPQKVQTGSAAAGGHRGVATRKATGDPATHGGAGDPETADGGIRTECTREKAPVQAIVVVLHDLTGWGSRVRLPPAQPSEATDSAAPQPCLAFPGVRTRIAEVPPDLPCTSLWIKSAVGSRGEPPRMPRYADFARARGIATLLPAYGLWGKCSDLSGSRAYGSSSSPHEESLAAHFPLIARKLLQYGTFSWHFSLLRLPMLAEVFPSLLV